MASSRFHEWDCYTRPMYKLVPFALAPDSACGAIVIAEDGLIWAATSVRHTEADWSDDEKPTPYCCKCEIEEMTGTTPADVSAGVRAKGHSFVVCSGVHAMTSVYVDHMVDARSKADGGEAVALLAASGKHYSRVVITGSTTMTLKPGSQEAFRRSQRKHLLREVKDTEASDPDSPEAGAARDALDVFDRATAKAREVPYPIHIELRRLRSIIDTEIIGVKRNEYGICPMCHRAREKDTSSLESFVTAPRCACVDPIPFLDDKAGCYQRQEKRATERAEMRLVSKATSDLYDFLRDQDIDPDAWVRVGAAGGVPMHEFAEKLAHWLARRDNEQLDSFAKRQFEYTVDQLFKAMGHVLLTRAIYTLGKSISEHGLAAILDDPDNSRPEADILLVEALQLLTSEFRAEMANGPLRDFVGVMDHQEQIMRRHCKEGITDFVAGLAEGEFPGLKKKDS